MLIPATFRPSEYDRSAFPGGTWVQGPTTQLNTHHLGVLHGRAIFPIKRLDRQCTSLLNDARKGALATAAGSLFQTDIVLEESCS